MFCFFVSDSGRQFPGAGLELLRRNQRSELGSFHYRVAKSWFDLWHSWKQPSNAAALKYSNFSEPCFICAFISSAVFLCSHKNHSVIKSHHSSRLPGLGRLQGKGAVILCQGARHRVQIRYSLENEPQRLLLSLRSFCRDQVEVLLQQYNPFLPHLIPRDFYWAEISHRKPIWPQTSASASHLGAGCGTRATLWTASGKWDPAFLLIMNTVLWVFC